MDTQHKKDKEETKRKLIEAAGEIFMSKGYSALNPSKIASIAGVSKTLVYRYFGNVQELFKAYLIQKDYWISFEDNIEGMLEENQHDSGRGLAKNTLENQIKYFLHNDEMQQIIRWQINEPNTLARSMANARERMGEEMFRIIDPYFKDSNVNFRALMAISVAGIYFLTLNARVNGSTICGLDLNTEDDIKELQNAVRSLVDMAYDKAKS